MRSERRTILLCSMVWMIIGAIVFISVPFATAQDTNAAMSTDMKDSSQAFTLSENGRPCYRILLGDEPTPVERTAAAELQGFLRQITGAEFPIITRKDVLIPSIRPVGLNGSGDMLLFVGDSILAREEFRDVDFDAISYDGIVLRTNYRRDILLTGHPQRGSLYAVYTFLEQYCGVRWWSSTEQRVPDMPTLTVTPPDVVYAPKLIYRESYYRDASEGVFAARSKCNGFSDRTTPEFGDHHNFVFFVHSFYPLIPPEKYFETHPEWFSEINGKRIFENAQLCLTNAEMRQELTKNAIEALRKNPGARFISISQNDWYNPCQCEKCKAIDDAEGSYSGTLITFVNQVAEEIEKEFPDCFVETLAYQYTRKPPKTVRPRANVVVRLCTIECSFVQPLENGEQNVSLREDMEGWSRIAPNLFVWDYVTNFTHYLIPHPNIRVLASNIRFFVKNHTIGLFEQGDYYTAVGDFVTLRNWVISKLMWDPDLDERALVSEFCNGYYGAAGPEIVRYLDRIHDEAEHSGVYLRCYMGDTSAWLSGAAMVECAEILDRAKTTVADDAVLLRRVRRATAAFDLNQLLRTAELREFDAQHGTRYATANPAEVARGWFTFVESQDNFSYREFTGRDVWDAYKVDVLRMLEAIGE